MNSSPLQDDASSRANGRHPMERVIDITSDAPSILCSDNSRETSNDEAEVGGDGEEEDSVGSDSLGETIYEYEDRGVGLTELEFSEHEYRRGLHPIPMQSPGDEAMLDTGSDGTSVGRNGRRRARLPALRKRHFFENDDIPPREYGGVSSRGRILKRITFRRRKRGEDDTFWTGILLLNVLSLAAMCVLVVYLTKSDFFESHQNDLFGTTVDNRFTVVSPESTDAKIYMKTGYSSLRYSEAMIAFGDGELKIGRRALHPTDTQTFYGLSLASNGTAAFTNKLTAPMIKTDYLHAARALVFDDGSAMTTAANLTGGLSEVGDLNLVSKTGSIALSAGGKRVLVIDRDATINVLNDNADDPVAHGITVDAAKGKVSIASSFQIHHDENATLVSSRHPIQLNTTRLVIGTVNSTSVMLTCPAPSQGEISRKTWAYKPMALAIVGQSSANQTQGGNVSVTGGDGFNSGGDVVITGGVSTDSDDDEVSRGGVFVNAGLDRTDNSMTEIGSRGASHLVSLQGSVMVNNGSESDLAASLHIGGNSLVATSRTITLDNAASNTSNVVVNSKQISLVASSGDASLVLGENATRLGGSKSVTVGVFPGSGNRSTALTMDHSGAIELNATGNITLRTTSTDASTTIVGRVRFGSSEEELSDADMMIDDGVISINAETMAIGAAGGTEAVSVKASRIQLGDASLKSNVTIAGGSTRLSSQRIQVGSSASHVMVDGHDIALQADSSIQIRGGNALEVSLEGGIVSVGGGKVRIGHEDTQSIEIGHSSPTGSIAITATSVSIGEDAKSIVVGVKSSAVKIGSEHTAVEIIGKVTVNGHVLDSTRRLQTHALSVFGIADTTLVAMDIPSASGDEIQIPIQLGHVSSEGDISTVDGNLQVGDAAAITHLRMGLSLDGIRLAVPHHASAHVPARPQKLRCRIYKIGIPTTVALELVTTLESCTRGDACDSGFFVGVNSQRIVAVQAGDRFSIRCAVSSVNKPSATLIIDRVQLDFASVV